MASLDKWFAGLATRIKTARSVGRTFRKTSETCSGPLRTTRATSGKFSLLPWTGKTVYHMIKHIAAGPKIEAMGQAYNPRLVNAR